MLKSILLAGSLIALFPVATLGRTPQEAAPTPAPAATPAPAPTPAPAAAPAPAPVAMPMPVDARDPVKPTADSQAKAKSVYGIDCSMCHGDGGNGKSDLATSMGLTLDNWTDPKTLANKQDGELFDMIRVGKDKMPPEDPGRATDIEVWNLVLYIRSFSTPLVLAPASAKK